METQAELYARIRRVYPTLTNQQCVELVRKVAGIRESVWDWRRGENVRDAGLKPGTPIATFLDRRGRPSEFYDAHEGVGAPGAGTTHSAIFVDYTKDGILVAEQYVGSGGPRLQEYRFGDPRGGEKAAENYFTIDTPSGAPAGENNPLRHEPEGEVSAYGYGIGARPLAPAFSPQAGRGGTLPQLARRGAIGRGGAVHPSRRAILDSPGAPSFGDEAISSVAPPPSSSVAAASADGPAVVLKFSTSIVMSVTEA